MHASDPTLLKYLRLMITEAHVQFQLNRIRSFREKVKQIKRQTERGC